MSRYHLLDAFQDVIFVVDRDWKLHFGNTGACLLLELTPRRLASGKPLAQFMEFTSPVTEGELSDVGELSAAREVMFRIPGSERSGWVQVVVQPVPEYMIDDAAAGPRWILSMRDTTLERTLNDKYRGELDQKESVIRDLQEARQTLEEYSHLLEEKVEERTVELRDANRLQKTILDSLGQGILVFDAKGTCLPIFSKVCLTMLNGEPTGRAITEVLGFDTSMAEGFTQWREAVFDQLLDFEDMVPLAPDHFRNEKGLDLHFNYYPMFGEPSANGVSSLVGVVIVATDRTREMAALEKAEAERVLVSKVTQVARNRDAFRLFVSEAKRLLGGLERPEKLDIDDIARRLHTLKGGAASFSILSVADHCHELENDVKAHAEARGLLDPILRQGAKRALEYLDEAIADLAELLGPSIGETEAQAIEIPFAQLMIWSRMLEGAEAQGAWSPVKQVATGLYEEATEKPVGPTVLHHSSSLKGLAASMGKRLDRFDVLGADTKLATERFQPLLASLVHAFRNCVYHGLELPDVRVRAGKSEGGRIYAHFAKTVGPNGRLRVEIGDDGAGADPERIRRKLNEKGLATLAAGSDEEVIQAILRDDFSTASEVSLVAGRGVGLSAIAGEVAALGGTIRVYSKPGAGLSLILDVPLSAAALAQSAAA